MDSKHGDAPFVLQSGKPKTLSESFTPSSLLLDAKNLTGKRDPTVATTLVTSITDFFNANPGTFSLCRSILDGTADGCRAAMAQLMVAESSDGTADGCRAAMAHLMVA